MTVPPPPPHGGENTPSTPGSPEHNAVLIGDEAPGLVQGQHRDNSGTPNMPHAQTTASREGGGVSLVPSVPPRQHLHADASHIQQPQSSISRPAAASTTRAEALRTKDSVPRWALFIGAILILVTALSVGLAYKWSVFGRETHEANLFLGKDIADTRAALTSAQDSLEVTRKQLNTAQERISELAKEKAQVGDDREQQRLIAQDTTAVATEALAVTRELAQCVELQSKYTENLRAYSNAQEELFELLGTDDDDQDKEKISKLRSAASDAAEELRSLSPEVKERCQAGVKRHNQLVEDLQE